MRKLSQINEGLWSKGIERSKSGDERIEDKLPKNNIKELKPVDLGLDFLIADNRLSLNGKEFFKLNDIYHYLPNIEKTGWRLPTIDEVNELCNLEYCKYNSKDNLVTFFNSNDLSIMISFNPTKDSFFSYSSGWKEDNGIIGAMFDVLAKRTNYIETRVLMDIFLYSVRLVKNKL